MLKSLVEACVRAGNFAHYARYRLLVIDEVERTATSGWPHSTLMTILDTRYTRRGTLVAVIATKRNPRHLPSELGYLASRMQDGERLHLSGSDLSGIDIMSSEEKLFNMFRSIWKKSLTPAPFTLNIYHFSLIPHFLGVVRADK